MNMSIMRYNNEIYCKAKVGSWYDLGTPYV